MNKKRRQHYIWRKYLERWSEVGKISCARGDKRFSASLTNVALETDMYQVVQLDEKEVEFVRRVFVNSAHPEIRKVQEGWIETFHVPSRVRNRSRQEGAAPGIERELDTVIHNVEEELHAHIEKTALPLLDDLVNGRRDFYAEANKRIQFLIFLCTQFSRTWVARDRMLRSVELVKPKLNYPMEVDFARVLPLVRHILATGLAYGIYSRHETMMLQFLTCDAEFITGDQPVVNSFAVGLPDGVAPTQMELYYPVSPDPALPLGRGC